MRVWSARSFLGFLVLLTALLGGCAPEEEEHASQAAAATQSRAATATSELREAIARREENDVRFAREMARMGAFLDETEQREAVGHFERIPDVHRALIDYHAKAFALTRELEAALRVGPSRDVFDGYALLATTPHAKAAVDFATRLLAHDPAFAVAGVRDEEIVERILAPALPAAFTELLLELGSARAAAAQLQGILRQAKQSCSDLAGWIDEVVRLGDVTKADSFELRIAGRSLSEGLRSIVAVIAIWQLGDAVTRGDAQAAVNAILRGGPDAVAGLAHATSLFRRLFLGIEETPFAKQIVRWSGRIAQGFAVVVNAIALIDDLKAWDAGDGAKLRVLADIVGLGSAILVFVGAGPAGAVAGLVSVGLLLLADFIQGQELAERERREMRAVLSGLGVSKAATDAIVQADSARARKLREGVGLAPVDMRWLAEACPWTVIGDEIPFTFRGLDAMKPVFDLDARGVAAVLRAAGGAEPGERRARVLRYFLAGLERTNAFAFSPYMSRGEGLQWLRDEAASSTVPGDIRAEWEAGFLGAWAFLSAAP